MKTIESSCPKLAGMIRDLDDAVETPDLTQRCERVKDILEAAFRSGVDYLPTAFLQPAESSYARRLLHMDPAGRYSVIAMVWDKGQGTSLHDHDGEWCVECVYRGRIRVVSYDLQGSESDPIVQFKPEKEIFAGVGEAGALIPPFEYHTLANANEELAVTIHVYGHELTQCGIFVPVEGGYRKEIKQLSYTP